MKLILGEAFLDKRKILLSSWSLSWLWDRKTPSTRDYNVLGVLYYKLLIISKSSRADFFGPSVSILAMASWVLIVPTLILSLKSLSK